jgi:hypothetical protein
MLADELKTHCAGHRTSKPFRGDSDGRFELSARAPEAMKKRAYRMDNTIIHKLLSLQTAAWSERGGGVEKLAEGVSPSR